MQQADQEVAGLQDAPFVSKSLGHLHCVRNVFLSSQKRAEVGGNLASSLTCRLRRLQRNITCSPQPSHDPLKFPGSRPSWEVKT